MTTKVQTEIENLLIQVIKKKQKNPHPVLDFLCKRLCCLNYLVYSSKQQDDKKIQEKLNLCLELYIDYKRAQQLQSTN
jgi:hypothetical protein